MNLDDFISDFEAEINAESIAAGVSKNEAFLNTALTKLADAAEIFDMTVCQIEMRGKRQKLLKIDAYGYDSVDDTLVCVVADFNEVNGTRLTKTEIESALNALKGFLETLEDYDQVSDWQGTAYETASVISAYMRTSTKIRLVLVSNRQLSERVKSLPAVTVGLLRAEPTVWDVIRFYEVFTSTLGREEIEIDLTQWLPEGLPVLKSKASDGRLDTYLAVIPGRVLAEIYALHGSRLLEGNVRSFLSLRSTVNRGMRTTLLNEPEKFLAYNNGLSTTATGVVMHTGSSLPAIQKISNLQIVNGGQTTASLHAYLRDEKEKPHHLDMVDVQLKLICLAPEVAENLVPKVAEYANTQNAIQASDFAANSPFHVRLEAISRRLNAGPKAGEVASTRWFYERARGSYLNEKMKTGSVKDQKKFEALYPRSQLITKTWLATYFNCWEQKPQIVSRGGQKNFAIFGKFVSEKYSTETNKDEISDEFFKRLVIKAIIHKTLRAAVMSAPWYEKGYAANIVAYAMARFALEIENRQKDLDWAALWKKQEMTSELRLNLLAVAEDMLAVLNYEKRLQKNVTEWAKTDGCWEYAKTVKINLSDGLLRELVQYGAEERRDDKKAQKEQGNAMSEVEKIVLLNTVSVDDWASIVTSGRLTISDKEANILKTLTVNRVVSNSQADVLIKLLHRAHAEGISIAILK